MLYHGVRRAANRFASPVFLLAMDLFPGCITTCPGQNM